MRQLWKARFRILQGQGGWTLIEVVVAVAILGAIGVAFMTSMDAAYRSVGVLDEKVQAEALARSQLEIIKDSPYQTSGNYSVTISLPTQYSMVINVEPPTRIGTADNYTSLEELIGGNVTTIQEITVVVSRTSSEGDIPVFRVAGYKSKVQ